MTHLTLKDEVKAQSCAMMSSKLDILPDSVFF